MENPHKTEYPQTIFALAHTDISRAPLGNTGRTLRLVVQANVSAARLYIRFSNRFGTQPLPVGAASIAPCEADGTLLAGEVAPLTVNGHLSFVLPPGEDVYSDVLAFPLQPGCHFAVNLYYPSGQKPASGNWLGTAAHRSRPGNYSAHLHMPGPGLINRFVRTVINTDFTVATTSVAQIVALCDAPGRVVGCFGDSITQQNTWTGPLEKRLHRQWPGGISLCNLGIGGNRLLSGSPPSLGGLNGPAGVERFEHDMLQLCGLTHAILAIGTNDIGLPGSHGLPNSQLITLAQYAAAMESLAEKLHQKNVLVYAATLCPRSIARPYTEEREALRQAMNEWIRTAPCFDDVIDFDEILRRSDGAPGMPDGCALPDGLHPTAFGGLHLAKSIPLSLFGEVHHEE